MCGICGFKLIDNIQEKNVLANLIKEIKNRGPDSTNTYQEQKIGLGMTRLAIRDIDNGNQPFENRELNLICVFNGEIYNYEILKKKIEKKGYKFKTKCDTELINPGFYFFGYNFFQMLNGMFAIAIYDIKEKKLILVRDRFGIKPLYIAKLKDNYYFSSSAKSIFNLSFFKKVINYNSLHSVLKNRYSKNNHIFNNIDEVKPGNILVIDKFNNVEEKYFIDGNEEDDDSEKKLNIENKLVNFFDNKLKDYEQADVPISIMLSSGIDSRILLEKLNKNISPYTIRFKNSKYDESKKVERICKNKNIKLNICDFNFEAMEENYNETINSFDKPICDSVIFPTFFLTKQISLKYKVTFSGEGADEIFGGYYYFNIAKKINLANKFRSNFVIRNIVKNTNYKILNYLFGYQGSIGKFGKERFLNFFNKDTKDINNFYNLISVFDDYEISKMLGKNIIENNLFKNLNIKNLMEDNIDNWLVKYNLSKIDQMSMYNGLEVRVPYMDNTFYNILNDIKKNSLFYLYNNKRVLKNYFNKYIQNIPTKKTAFQNYYTDSQIKNYTNLIENKINKNSYIFQFIEYQKYYEILNDFKKRPELL